MNTCDEAHWLAENDAEIENLAADLWRLENPSMSVFECDFKMKEEYRKRAIEILQKERNR